MATVGLKGLTLLGFYKPHICEIVIIVWLREPFDCHNWRWCWILFFSEEVHVCSVTYRCGCS